MSLDRSFGKMKNENCCLYGIWTFSICISMLLLHENDKEREERHLGPPVKAPCQPGHRQHWAHRSKQGRDFIFWSLQNLFLAFPHRIILGFCFQVTFNFHIWARDKMNIFTTWLNSNQNAQKMMKLSFVEPGRGGQAVPAAWWLDGGVDLPGSDWRNPQFAQFVAAQCPLAIP